MKTLLLVSLVFTACVHAPRLTNVTGGTRTSVTQATDATTEASKASQRSSGHIKEFKSDAERIDFKATRALQLL